MYAIPSKKEMYDSILKIETREFSLGNERRADKIRESRAPAIGTRAQHQLSTISLASHKRQRVNKSG